MDWRYYMWTLLCELWSFSDLSPFKRFFWLNMMLALMMQEITEIKETENMTDDRRVHPDCRNASNPYHECSEYCFKLIAEIKKQMSKAETGKNWILSCNTRVLWHFLALTIQLISQKLNHLTLVVCTYPKIQKKNQSKQHQQLIIQKY